ncbi:MAG TPA: NAD(P)/FAD-dependent oxidoreductase [Acidimicrobiales bacterium]|nr:NAD(P)/FAD-dependent oxidoreductase [Acidimicrobiales bacterium]
MSGATTNVDTRHHVVIVGCGFGGLFAAKALKRENVRVTIIDRTNHHLFQPLLYQVATGILSEGQIAPAIRDVMRRYESINVVLGLVVHIDVAAKQVHVDEFGHALTIDYDSLIVAGGATTSYFGHDEFRHTASGMKSLDDALALRGEIFGAFELAEAEPDETARRRLMTFVVVGGGPTGVEISGQLRELSRRALRRNYRRIKPEDARVVLVEGTDHLLGSMGGRVARLTERKLTRMGVELHLGAMVSGMDDEDVEITDSDGNKERIPAATRIWAAGTRASGLGEILAKEAGAELDKAGRVRVAPDCSVPGHPEVFAIGDLMALDDLPGLAEVAMQSGAHAAHTIVRRLEGKEPKDFHYRDLGTLAVISRFTAVAHIGPVQVGGFIGWLLWLVVHVTFLTGFKNRFGALARWAVSFVGHGRYERALTGRWVARVERPSGSA